MRKKTLSFSLSLNVDVNITGISDVVMSSCHYVTSVAYPYLRSRTKVKRVLPQIAPARCMQSCDVICRVNSDKELTHGLQHCQVRGIPHDVLNNVHVQRTDYSGNLLTPFTLALLGTNTTTTVSEVT